MPASGDPRTVRLSVAIYDVNTLVAFVDNRDPELDNCPARCTLCCLTSGIFRCLAPGIHRCLAPSIRRCLAPSIRRCLAPAIRRCLAPGIFRCLASGILLCLALRLRSHPSLFYFSRSTTRLLGGLLPHFLGFFLLGCLALGGKAGGCFQPLGFPCIV